MTVAAKLAWQIVNGPMEFDLGSVYTKVEFTVTPVGTSEKVELHVFIDTARRETGDTWSFRGRISAFDLGTDRDVMVTGIYNVEEQDGNLSEVAA